MGITQSFVSNNPNTAPGGTCNFTWQITNDGPGLEWIWVYNGPPGPRGWQSWAWNSGGGGATGNTSSGQTTAGIAEEVYLPGFSTVTYTLDVIVPAGAAPGTFLSLQAGVADMSGAGPGGVFNYVTPNTGTTVGAPVFTHTYVANTPNVKIGDGATLTWRITNTGTGGGVATLYNGPPSSQGWVNWWWASGGTGGVTGNTSNSIPGNATVNDSVTIPTGGYVEYTFYAQVPATAQAGTIISSVAAVKNGGAPWDYSPPAQVTVTNPIVLQISNASNTVKPGGTVEVWYDVINTSLGPVNGIAVNVEIPTGIPGLTAAWTAVESGPGVSTGATSGSGAVAETINLTAGTVWKRYKVVYTVPVNASCSGSFTPYMRADANA